MKKLVLRVAGGALLTVVLLFLLGWMTLRASLPDVDGEVPVAGLEGAATISRDATGLPVIIAGSRSDLAFATGYAHGQDRFFQMDLIRRQSAGELSEIVGAATLRVDKTFRLHRFRSRAQAVLAQMTADELRLLQQYAAGVNSGLSSLDARPFEYFVLGVQPEPWTAEDSILAVYTMFAQLNDSRAQKELGRGYAHNVLSTALYAWMYPDGTPWDAPLLGEPRPALPIPGRDVVSLRGTSDRDIESDETGRKLLRGSNNWAVSGALTKDGRAIVSNDMHLGLDVPNVYYRARLQLVGDTSLDISGVTLPGTPFVIAGSNSQVAWGFTNSYGDYTDAVLLVPGTTAGTYMTPDGERAFTLHAETIIVKGEDAVEYVVRETMWGPVRDDIEYPDGDIAVSWIAHKPESVNLKLLQLESASSVTAALDIANTIGMPPQNFVSGDAGGNIAWTIAGKIPTRADYDPMLPADWSQQHGWTGWLAPENYPRIVNPDSGRIWTANSRVADGDTLQVIGDGGYDLGARSRQIRDGLFARETFTPEDMLAIQYDDRAIFLAPWRDLLLGVLDGAAVADDADLKNYRDLVRNWSGRAEPESVAYRLVRAFRLEVERRIFHALTAPVREEYGADVRIRKSNQFEAVLWSLVTEQPMHMLPGEHESWQAFFLASVHSNLRYFADNYEGPLENRTWGEINTAAIQHPLANSIPLLGQYLNMRADPLNGDSDMPKAQGPSTGASERFSVSPGAEAGGLLHMPTGASGHPLSAYYDAGHSDWVSGLPSPFLPGTAEHTLTLVPIRR